REAYRPPGEHRAVTRRPYLYLLPSRREGVHPEAVSLLPRRRRLTRATPNKAFFAASLLAPVNVGKQGNAGLLLFAGYAHVEFRLPALFVAAAVLRTLLRAGTLSGLEHLARGKFRTIVFFSPPGGVDPGKVHTLRRGRSRKVQAFFGGNSC